MKPIYIFLFIFYSLHALANLDMAPDNFKYNQMQLNFIDIIQAHYTIDYDTKNEKATALSIIEFQMLQDGHPLFDLVEEALSIKINGRATKLISIPQKNKSTFLRTISHQLKAGRYRLEVVSPIKRNVVFKDGTASSAFFFSDLSERSMLEKYLPTNLEYDQYQMYFRISFSQGSKFAQRIFTNGKIMAKRFNTIDIQFPKYLNCSSTYLHVLQENQFSIRNFSYQKSNKQKLPIELYAKKVNERLLDNAQNVILKVLKELENDFGTFPHPKLVVYITGARGGGMEYAGATTTSARSLVIRHEIFHSYFARSYMPVNGDSGWVDEALASWNDKNQFELTSPGFNSSNMGNISQYKRSTDRRAYSQGRNFMAYLNYKLKPKGGLKPFIKKIYQNRLFKVTSTIQFQKLLEQYSGMNLSPEFNRYIYGKMHQYFQREQVIKKYHVRNPFHEQLSEYKLNQLL